VFVLNLHTKFKSSSICIKKKKFGSSSIYLKILGRLPKIVMSSPRVDLQRLESKFCLFTANSLLFRVGGRAGGRAGAGYSKNTTNSVQLS
jgi:hypothetical protein